MEIVKWIMIGIHLLASFGLIILILLHAGRGGGLSDVFGGGMMASQLGGSTLAERNLDRLTIGMAIVFAITTGALIYLLAP